jgi:hypothetical protein
MAALQPALRKPGPVAERAEVREPILNHCLPAGPDAISPAAWERRAGHGFSGKPTAGRDGMRPMLAACGHDHLPNGAADS